MRLFKSDLYRNIAIGFALGVGAMFTIGGAQIGEGGLFDVQAKADEKPRAETMHSRAGADLDAGVRERR